MINIVAAVNQLYYSSIVNENVYQQHNVKSIGILPNIFLYVNTNNIKFFSSVFSLFTEDLNIKVLPSRYNRGQEGYFLRGQERLEVIKGVAGLEFADDT